MNAKMSPWERLGFFVYHWVWRMMLFVARLAQRHLPPKLKAYLEERQFPQLVWRVAPRLGQRIIWFHAASGELEYIKPILRLWKQRHPEDLLFVSYFSTSARKMLNQIPEVDGWAPLPYDLPEDCEPFLTHLQPSSLVIARTDLWPTLLYQMNDRPKILVASTWSEGSKKTRGFGRWMSVWCLKYLNKVCVVSAHDAQWISEFAPDTTVVVTGDPRFDQVNYRLEQARELPAKLRQWSQDHFVVIAGSTWPEDERVLLPAWAGASLNKSRLLIVPHETNSEHIEELQQNLKHHGLDSTLWSEVAPTNGAITTNIVIFDQKGWLAELYRLGQLALIGGSFKEQVHSVMEALGCGLPVLLGPYYKNNREAIEFSALQWQGHPLAESVCASDDLLRALQKHRALSAEEQKAFQTEVRQQFLKRCSSSEKTYQEVISALEVSVGAAQ